MLTQKYSEILKSNREFGTDELGTPYSVCVLSNISIFQIKEILEFYLKQENINAKVKIGNYDNILQDSKDFNDFDLVVVFWEIVNIIDGFYYKVNKMIEAELDSLSGKVKNLIKLAPLKTPHSIISPLTFKIFL